MSHVVLDCRALVSHADGRALHSPLDWQVRAGERCCVLGRNGAGKTTLFRTLLGLHRPLSGHVNWLGKPLHTLSLAARARAVAYVPQRAPIPDGMTVGEYVRYSKFFPAKSAEFAPQVHDQLNASSEIAPEIWDSIAEFRHRHVSTLSGGEMQRVAIARARAQGARAIVLDEPTAHLDLAQSQIISRQIAAICAAGTAMIFSTHDPSDALNHADHVLAFLPGGAIEYRAANATDAAWLSAIYQTSIAILDSSDGMRYVVVRRA